MIQGLSGQTLIVGVLYAPPGNLSAPSKSIVEYDSGSTLGTTTSATKSVKAGYDLSVELTGKIVAQGGAGAQFDYSSKTTTSHSLDIRKTTTSKLAISGPNKDGVDHDEDEILVLLNPTIIMKSWKDHGTWMIDDGEAQDIIALRVAELRDPKLISPSFRKTLDHYGITDSELEEVLTHDPLATKDPPIFSPPRYLKLSQTFPYRRPLKHGDPQGVSGGNISTNSFSQDSVTAEDDVTVVTSWQTGFDLFNFVNSSLKSSSSMTFTNIASQQSSEGTTEGATFTIGWPSESYNGPEDIEVYFDTIYRTFAFRPVEWARQEVQGVVRDVNGDVRRSVQVKLQADGRTLSTITDSYGRFRLPGDVKGAAVLTTSGVSKNLTKEELASPIELKVQ